MISKVEPSVKTWFQALCAPMRRLVLVGLEES
jgi:hypothetical protein